MIGNGWLYGRKWPGLSLSQKGNWVPPIYSEGPQEIWSFPCFQLKDTTKCLSLHKKTFVGGGGGGGGREGVYTKENKDTNRRKWDIVEITIRIIILFEICIHYFLYREFSSLTWKNHPHLKSQFPPKIPIWPGTSYINLLKNGWISHSPMLPYMVQIPWNV